MRNYGPLNKDDETGNRKKSEERWRVSDVSNLDNVTQFTAQNIFH